jgi:hypothetical protein
MMKMVKNKKAWLRIVEATIAILLLASVLAIMVVRIPRGDNAENINDIQRFVLEQVSKNDTLREEILSGTVDNPPKDKTDKFIGKLISYQWSYLDYDFRVCEVEKACGIGAYPPGAENKEIYSDEILITSNLTEYSPRKLRLFIWRK